MGISKRFVAKNGLDNNSQTITNVADPVNAQDVATKAFTSNASNLTTGTVSETILPSSGVQAGTYAKVTVDSKGRVTGGSTTLSPSDFPSSILVGDGTAALPSIAFTDDIDTGIYSSSDNTLAITTAGSKRVSVSSAGVDVVGDLSVTGLGKRITGDFSSDTHSNRLMFQTNVGNGNTNIHALPNGTASTSNFYAHSGSDPQNSSRISIGASPTMVTVASEKTGSGEYLPLTFRTNAAERMRIDNSGNLGVGTTTPQSKLDVNGDITLSGTGRKILGDFSNATFANRTVFQTSVANSTTSLTAAPSGTGTSANYTAVNKSDVANASVAVVAATDVDVSFRSTKRGTGTYLPMTFFTSDVERMRVDTSGNVVVGGFAPTAPGTGRRIVVSNFEGTSPWSNAGITLNTNKKDDNNTPTGLDILKNKNGDVYFNNTEPSSSANYQFAINNSTKMVIDSAGSVGIGELNPSGWNSKLAVRGTGNAQVSVLNTSGATSSEQASLSVMAGGRVSSMYQRGDGLTGIDLNGVAGKDKMVLFKSDGFNRWLITSDSTSETGSNAGSNLCFHRYADNGNYLGVTYINRSTGAWLFESSINPIADNGFSCGSPGNRWSTVYAASGTINTSDAREKTEVRSLEEAEITAAKQIAKEIGAYKFLSAIAEKGDAAREHIGLTVQKAIEIMETNGLDPFNYGFICYDEWDEQTQTVPAVPGKEAVLDDDGNVIEEAVEEVPAYEKVTVHAGNRFSFRTDELNLFIARGLAAQLESVEARLAALEA